MQQDRATTEHHEEVTPVEARQAKSVGLWKILAASLVLAVIGFVIVGGIVGA